MNTSLLKKILLTLTIITLAAQNITAAIATQDTMDTANTQDSTGSQKNDATSSPATDANIPDDQLTLPITLVQFKQLQDIIQEHDDNAANVSKKLQGFVEDLLKDPNTADTKTTK